MIHHAQTNGDKCDLFWPINGQMARLEPYFQKSYGKPASMIEAT